MHAKNGRPSNRIGEAAASAVIGKMKYSIRSKRFLMEECEIRSHLHQEKISA